MSEFLLVQLLENQSQDEFHGTLPLYFTLIPPFGTSAKNKEVVETIASTAQELGSITTTAIERDMFGSDNDVSVTRLERTPSLVKLHFSLIHAVLDELDAQFDTRWSGAAWNPHVSDAGLSRLRVGDEVIIDAISLIKRTQDIKHKKVIDTINL